MPDAAPSVSLPVTTGNNDAPNVTVTAISGGVEGNSATPLVKVSFAGSGATAVTVGDTITLSATGGATRTYIVQQADIDNGYANVSINNLGSNGVYSLTATITDAVSNVSNASTALNYTLDSTPPVLATAAVNGSTLVLTYTENDTLSATAPLATDFTVMDGSTQITVSSVVVDATNKTVTLTLAGAIQSR